MKKRKNQRRLEDMPVQNPVAKFAHQFNKAQVFCDKNHYRRNAKHRKQEASASILAIKMFAEAACVGAGSLIPPPARTVLQQAIRVVPKI